MNGAALLRYLTLPFTVAPLLLVAIFAVLLQIALHAEQPRGVAAMIRRLGPGYLVVMAIAATCGWLAQCIAIDATHLALLLRIALVMLLWLVLFSTLGGVIHERRFEIGFEPERSPEATQRKQAAPRQRERDRFVDQVFAEYRAGSSVNAWASIQQRVGQGAGALAEYEWLYPRLAEWTNPSLANRVAHELLTLLLAGQRNGDAVKLVKERLQADAQFRPATGEQTLRVAQLARDAGDWPLARALIADFEQRFADHPVRGSVVLLAEQLHKR